MLNAGEMGWSLSMRYSNDLSGDPAMPNNVRRRVRSMQQSKSVSVANRCNLIRAAIASPSSFQHPVERRDGQQEQRKTRHRVLQALNIKSAGDDDCESGQSRELRVRREGQPDR